MKILVVNIAALSQRVFNKFPGLLSALEALPHQCPVQPAFPALTCTAQANYSTGQLPSEHGVVANGWLFPDVGRPLFWEQNAKLVQSPRIWDVAGWDNAILFHQQTMGLDCMMYSPRPIHKHWGGLIMAAYSNPDDLQKRLADRLGPFPLHRYWGPIASIKSTEYIVNTTVEVMEKENKDVVWTYIPHLDYCFQKLGPDHADNKKHLEELNVQLIKLFEEAEKNDYKVVAVGDYGIEPVDKVIPLALKLRQAGLYKLREVKGREYPDYLGGLAIPVCDHQVAHIYCQKVSVKDVLKSLEGLEGCRFITAKDQEYSDIEHARCGDIVAIADEGYWFSYKYWEDESRMPDFADHIAIHYKPGYDPCELFFKRKIPTSWPPKISLNESLVKGSHGVLHNKEDRPVMFNNIQPPRSELLQSTDVAWFIKDMMSHRY